MKTDKKETLETKYTSLQHLTKSRIFKQIYPLAAFQQDSRPLQS